METASGILVLGCRNSAIPTDGSVTAIGSQAFFHCEGLTEVQIPDGVHTIEAFAFTGCSSLTDVSIPDSVITIESYAFTGCGLTAIALPASVTAMGSEVFVGCGDLQSITVSPDNMVYHSAGNCLIETKSGTLLLGCNNSVIPADGSVTSIGAQAFAGCGELTDITIPASVTQMESGAFYGCTGLQSITVSPDNMVYHSAGNCLIETNSKTLLLGCNNSVIPTDGSVTAIGAQAFAGCKGLISLTIPHSVTAIGYAAFVDCENLGSITVLNPNCEWTIIYDALMFSTRFPAGVTLYGYASSTTQTMAERYGIPFLLIED